MTHRKSHPAATEIDDTDLDNVQGGAESVFLTLQANGSDVQVAEENVRNVGLRSDGELVQAAKAPKGVKKR